MLPLTLPQHICVLFRDMQFLMCYTDAAEGKAAILGVSFGRMQI